MPEFFYLTHEAKQKISTFLVVAIATFGVGGIMVSSYFQSQNRAEINGISQSISSSSLTAESSKSSQSQASSSQLQPTTQPENQAVTPSITLSQQYSNPSYPDLLIRYPNNWVFDTQTSPSLYDGLANRSIILTKENSKITVLLELAVVRDCYPSQTPFTSQQQLKNGLSRYATSPTDFTQYYGITDQFKAPCSSSQHRLNSTVISNQFTAAMNENKVYAWVSIQLESTNPQHINEADQIINQLKTTTVR